MLATVDSTALADSNFECHGLPYISLLSSPPTGPNRAESLHAAESGLSSPLPFRKKPKTATSSLGSRAAPIPAGVATGFRKASKLALDLNSGNDEIPNGSNRDIKRGREEASNPPKKPCSCDSDQQRRDDTAISEYKMKMASALPLKQIRKKAAAVQTAIHNMSIVKPGSMHIETIANVENQEPRDPRWISKEGARDHNSSISATNHDEIVDNAESRACKASATLQKEEEANKKRKISHAHQIRSQKESLDAKTKTKKLPKKPITVTANAIAKAQVNVIPQLEESENNMIQPPLIAPLDLTQLYQALGPARRADDLYHAERSTAVRDGKTRKRKIKTPKRMVVTQKLKSPSSAISRMNRQDFVFGTSSQLARDEKASCTPHSEATFTASAIVDKPSSPLCRLSINQNMNSRDLWSAGARADNDDFLFVADSNSMHKSQSEPKSDMKLTGAVPSPSMIEPETKSILEVDLTGGQKRDLKQSHSINAPAKKLPNTKSSLKLSVDKSLMPQMALKTISNIQVSSSGASVISDIMSSHSASKIRLMSTSTKFKQASGKVDDPKETKISKVEDRSESSRTRSSNSRLDSGKRPRGRPKKNFHDKTLSKLKEVRGGEQSMNHTINATAVRSSKNNAEEETLEHEEIEDNERPSPSLPRFEPKQNSSQLTLSRITANQDKNLENEVEEDNSGSLAEYSELEIFPWITSMVKSQPMSKDAKTPNWYEKILLYDPLILEDFTDWLNSSASPDIHAPGDDSSLAKYLCQRRTKLKPVFVQKWCQKNGICCLWKSGSFRQRF